MILYFSIAMFLYLLIMMLEYCTNNFYLLDNSKDYKSNLKILLLCIVWPAVMFHVYKEVKC